MKAFKGQSDVRLCSGSSSLLYYFDSLLIVGCAVSIARSIKMRWWGSRLVVVILKFRESRFSCRPAAESEWVIYTMVFFDSAPGCLLDYDALFG